MSWQIKHGHVIDVLKSMRAKSVQCVVTSPPYFGLRDYKNAPTVWGGSLSCAHAFTNDGDCSCGAWLGTLGNEPTPNRYVSNMASVFREVRRVLRDDGVLFLNLGDSYFGDSPARSSSAQAFSESWDKAGTASRGGKRRSAKRVGDLKPKDLIGIPWMTALALRADGWYLRSEIIWGKGVSFCESYSGSIMPEPVRDRFTKSHETIFMLTKSSDYFFDAVAIEEAGVYPAGTVAAFGSGTREGNRISSSAGVEYSGTRNVRSVWLIPATGFDGEFCLSCRSFFDGPDRGRIRVVKINEKKTRVCPCGGTEWLSHFATFPVELVMPMLKSGTSAYGACSSCGAAYARVTEKRPLLRGHSVIWKAGRAGESKASEWAQACSCRSEARPCIVLDTFSGSGTVSLVAQRLNLDAIGIDTNADYAEMSRARIRHDAPLFNVSTEAATL